jgi:hypothetical protein
MKTMEDRRFRLRLIIFKNLALDVGQPYGNSENPVCPYVIFSLGRRCPDCWRRETNMDVRRLQMRLTTKMQRAHMRLRTPC